MKHILPSATKACFAIWLAIACCIGLNFGAAAQGLDSKGTDFWLTFPSNIGTSNAYLYISGEQSTSGTVSVPGVGFTQSFSVTAGQITTISLPSSVFLNSSGVIGNNGIHVTSLKEVTIYGMNLLGYTTDAYLGSPTDVLGMEYLVMSYQGALGSQIGIVAAENATTVTFKLTASTGAYAAGTSYNVTLNQGQTFYLHNTSGGDLTGSVVTSTKPIAVFSGNQCANVPTGYGACDHIVEQMVPTSGMGKNFVSFPLKTRSGDTYRFLASANNTVVSVNGAPVATLNRGQFFEKIYNIPVNITATQPILVAQFSNGSNYDNANADPFMMLISPYEQFLGAYTVNTPSSGFAYNFVNVVAPNAAVGTIKLDGVVIPASQFVALGSTGYSGAQVNLSVGVHNLTSAGLPFGAFVYGFNNYDSYGYPAGTSYSPIAAVNSIVLSPKTGSGDVGQQACFTATVKDQYNNPVAGVRVDFTLTGANPQSSGFGITDANGVATYCYTGANPGADNITAAVGTLTDAGSLTWTCTAPLTYTVTGGGAVCVGGAGVAVGLSASQSGVSYQLKRNGSNVGPAVAGTGGPLSFGLQAAPGTYTVVGSLTAGCYSVMSNSVAVTVNNDAPVALGKNVTVSLQQNLAASVAAQDIDNGSYDACSGVSLSITSGKTTYGCADIGATFPVVLTATDQQGLTSSVTVQVTVADAQSYCNKAPVAVAKALTLAADANCQATAAAQDFENGSSDPDGDAISFSVYPAGPYALGTTAVTFTVTDARGASSSVNTSVTVVDKTAPVPLVAALPTATGECSVTVIAPKAKDNCAGFITATTTDPVSYTAQGTYTITWTYADGHGNSASQQQTVVVKDVTPPTITGPADITFNTGNGTCGAVYNYTIGGGAHVLTQAVPTITLEGSMGSTKMNVAYNPLKDLYYLARGGWSALPIETFSAAGSLLYTSANSGHDWRGIWWNPVANQLEGNPCATCPSNGIRKQDLGANGFALGTGTNILPVGQPDFQSKGDYDYDANEVVYYDNGKIFRYSHANGAFVGSINITGLPVSFSALNPHFIGYTGIAGKEVIVYDMNLEAVYFINKTNGAYSGTCQMPAFAGAINPYWGIGYANGQLFLNDGNSPKTYGFRIVAAGSGLTDNCGPVTLTQTTGLPSGSLFPVGTTTNTFVATDAAGNTATYSFDVTVKDTQKPTVLTQNITVQLDANGVASITPAQIDNGSSDNCAIAAKGYSLSKTSFDCSNIGTNTVTLTVTDVNGNASTATAVVTVEDQVAPVALAKNLTIQLDANGSAAITAAMVNNGSHDACGIQSLALSKAAFSCANVGANTVTLIVTDNHGNVSTVDAVVTVEDQVAPVALAKNITLTLANGAASISAADIDNGSSDACGIASMEVSKAGFSCDEIGDHTVTLTVTDKNGNVSSATAVVTVKGVKPVASIAVSRTDNTYTGAGTENTIFLGFGAQSLTLTAANATSAAAATTYAWSPATGLSSASSANPVFTPTAAGTYTYTVTATNEYGCSATATVTLTVIDARGPNGKVVICHKGQKTIIASSAVQAHLAHGCTIGSCSSVAATNARVATNIQVADAIDLTVYPNPLVNKATIEFTLVEEGSYRVEIYDMRGALVKVVDKGRGEANKFYSYELDATAYPAGVYLVKLSADQQVLTKRIVVQK